VLRPARAGQTAFEARARRFEPFADGAPVEIAPGVTGWTGGAYCCWTLHLLHRGPQGLAQVATLPLGKREPDVVRLAVTGGGLRARDWSTRDGDHPGVETARLAACLLYSGHAAEAQRLLRAAWPEGAPGPPQTERQLAARRA
jgi:hypothetical protein